MMVAEVERSRRATEIVILIYCLELITIPIYLFKNKLKSGEVKNEN